MIGSSRAKVTGYPKVIGYPKVTGTPRSPGVPQSLGIPQLRMLPLPQLSSTAVFQRVPKFWRRWHGLPRAPADAVTSAWPWTPERSRCAVCSGTRECPSRQGGRHEHKVREGSPGGPVRLHHAGTMWAPWAVGVKVKWLVI